MTDRRLRLGIDLGGTKVAVGGVDTGGALVGALSLVHDGTLPGVLTTVRRALSQLREEGIGHPFVSAGVGVPGAVDDEGRISLCPALPDLESVDLSAALGDLLGVAVEVENDSNAAALGEYRYGNHGVEDLACVCLGTGIGLGLVSDGRLLRGAHGLAAEIADLSVDDGTGQQVRTEDVAHAAALARAAGHADKAAMPQVLAEHDRGSAAAIGAVGRYAAVVANAVVATAVLVDPAVVLLSGGLGSQPAIADQVTGRIRAQRPGLPVRIARYGARSPLVGAASLTGAGRDTAPSVRWA